MAETLAELLSSRVAKGTLCERLPENRVRCVACGHRCVIADGHEGICRVRFNRGGTLFVPHGYVGALQLDPVEKKPFFHALPGAKALSFGMLGCDFHCAYCQNWVTSQALRDPASEHAGASPEDITPKRFVDLAIKQGAKIVTSTYNEPLITIEWAVDIFKEAKVRGLLTSYVSNGNGTREVLQFIRPWVDLYKVDLKGFSDATYRRVMGGVLQHVLDTIPMLVEMGFWVEIVTLIIPGVNDSDEELKGMANFLAGVSKDLPWHVTAFHKDYKMMDPADTTAETLIRAAEIGSAAGLRYIYAGNLPGQVGRWENTFCPGCGKILIERFNYKILKNNIKDSACPSCKTIIPGVWKVPISSVA